MGPNPAGYVDGAARRTRGAPAAGRIERRAERPFLAERVEDEGTREGGEERVGSGGQQDEFSGDGKGLDGEIPGEEGGVAEDRAERRVSWRRREGVPRGRDRIEGKEMDGIGKVGLGLGGQEEGVERKERREGGGVDEAAP